MNRYWIELNESDGMGSDGYSVPTWYWCTVWDTLGGNDVYTTEQFRRKGDALMAAAEWVAGVADGFPGGRQGTEEVRGLC